MFTNSSILIPNIYKKFDKYKMRKCSHIEKSAISFAQVCTYQYMPVLNATVFRRIQ